MWLLGHGNPFHEAGVAEIAESTILKGCPHTFSDVVYVVHLRFNPGLYGGNRARVEDVCGSSFFPYHYSISAGNSGLAMSSWFCGNDRPPVLLHRGHD